MPIIRQDLKEALQLLELFVNNNKNIESIEAAGKILVSAFREGNKVISCGNGGSMSDAMHFAEELTGKYRDDRISLPAISISDPSFLTCTANDFGYSNVFSRFIEGMGKRGDVLFAISTSGNSQNIIEAVNTAQEKGMKVIGLTGKNGGELAKNVDIEIRVPYNGYADRIQEIHIKIIHALIHFVEQNLGLLTK